MKNEQCAPNITATRNLEELQKSERRHKLERNFFLGSVVVLAIAFVIAAFLARESIGYTIFYSFYTSVGFVLIMMIDKASKKLRKVRREIRLR